MHLLHGDFCSHRAERIDELAFQQFAQRFRLHGALAQGLRRIGYRIGHRLHADIEFRQHVDAHAVFGDNGGFAAALHLQPQRVHVHGNDLVDDR
jgi:hypothetical protein